MKMRSTNIAWILFFSALPLTAHPVDGVYEINQACVPVGCFPGDDPGFPVEITQAGSYRLTSNLMVPDENTTAIQVDTSDGDVTVDLNGFEIAGPTVCYDTCTPTGNGVGIEVVEWESGRSTSVRNGIVRGMGSHGVFIGLDGHVESVQVKHNGGVGIYGGSIVRDCIARWNGSHGISTAIGVVTGNVATRNMGDGILCSAYMIVTDNVSHWNMGNGLGGQGSCGYSNNVFTANNGSASGPQVDGNLLEIGINVCGNDTTCP